MQRRSPSEPRTHRSASLRPRRSRPPAQGCGRKNATLGPCPAKQFNPNGVAPHTPFSHPSRPEPLCGSIATPPIPRVGLSPFGQPWAGGRKPFGLGGRAPVLSIPRQTHSSPNAFLAKRRRHSALQPGRFPTPTAFPASSPGLRSRDRYPGTMSRETIQPQRGCASYAFLPSVTAGTALRFNRLSTHSPG